MLRKDSEFIPYHFRFVSTLRGHVQRVYQVAWSADSRLLCSSSADSTLKVWDIKEKKLLFDLPGHADEVGEMKIASLRKCSKGLKIHGHRVSDVTTK